MRNGSTRRAGGSLGTRRVGCCYPAGGQQALEDARWRRLPCPPLHIKPLVYSARIHWPADSPHDRQREAERRARMRLIRRQIRRKHRGKQGHKERLAPDHLKRKRLSVQFDCPLLLRRGQQLEYCHGLQQQHRSHEQHPFAAAIHFIPFVFDQTRQSPTLPCAPSVSSVQHLLLPEDRERKRREHRCIQRNDAGALQREALIERSDERFMIKYHLICK